MKLTSATGGKPDNLRHRLKLGQKFIEIRCGQDNVGLHLYEDLEIDLVGAADVDDGGWQNRLDNPSAPIGEIRNSDRRQTERQKRG